MRKTLASALRPFVRDGESTNNVGFVKVLEPLQPGRFGDVVGLPNDGATSAAAFRMLASPQRRRAAQRHFRAMVGVPGRETFGEAVRSKFGASQHFTDHATRDPGASFPRPVASGG